MGMIPVKRFSPAIKLHALIALEKFLQGFKEVPQDRREVLTAILDRMERSLSLDDDGSELMEAYTRLNFVMDHPLETLKP